MSSLDGGINLILQAVGLESLVRAWLGDRKTGLWAIMFVNFNPDIRTVALSLVIFHDALNRPEPGPSVIASLPLVLLFFFSMRTFIAGLTSGSVKM